MAASRLERIGSIYTRVRGLLKSGAMKPEDKPIWYEVYEAFPPKIEPSFGRKDPDIPIRNILYEEDIIRAKFYKKFGSPGVISLMNNKFPTPSQKFLTKYKEMEKDFTNEDELFDAVAKALESEKALAQEEQAANTNPTVTSMFKTAVTSQQQQKQPTKFSVENVLQDKDEK